MSLTEGTTKSNTKTLVGRRKIFDGSDYIICDRCNGSGMIDFDGFRDLVLKADIDKLDTK